MQIAYKASKITLLVLTLCAPMPHLKAHGDHRDHDPKVLPLTSEVKIEGLSEDALKSVSAAYVESVEPIFRRACFDCHSDQTHFPWYAKVPLVKQWIESDIKEAREHLDMSQSFPFQSKHGIDHDLEELNEVIEAGNMPPKAYAFMHNEAAISENDRQLILTWIKKSQDTFGKLGAPKKP